MLESAVKTSTQVLPGASQLAISGHGTRAQTRGSGEQTRLMAMSRNKWVGVGSRRVCPMACVAVGLTGLLTSGCASMGNGGDRAASAAQGAMTQPLRDFGLIRPTIPPELSRIVDPYAPPMGPGCAWLNYELAGLESVLGNDGTRSAERRRSGTEVVSDAADSAVRGAVSDLIPARGLVRQLSGAEAADREMARAQERGRVRRAYLMGLSHANECGAPPAVTPASVVPTAATPPAP